MFNDSISLGTTPVSYIRKNHATPTSRAKWSPSGDISTNLREFEVSHEVTRAKRQNSLVKFKKNVVNSVTGAVAEISYQIKISIPPEATAADVEAVRDHAVSFQTNANLIKLMNQEA